MTDMRNIDHTHPNDDRSTGRVFRRGPTVAADGGQRDAEDRDEGSQDTMRDVDHDDPEGEGANRVFERGREHADETGDVAEE